jgi:hypothetical protein
MNIDTDILRASLFSSVCSACGRSKKPRDSICGWDYRQLPMDMKAALYDLMGDGYEEAFVEAMRHLGHDRIALPEGAEHPLPPTDDSHA